MTVLTAVVAAATVALFVPVLSKDFLYGISAISVAAVALHRVGRTAALHLLRRTGLA